jgi:hypothetical protein
MSLDRFYTRRRTRDYKCFDLACEVWNYLTGENLRDRFMSNGSLKASITRAVSPLAAPVSPCLVVMQRKGYSPHIGVYYDGRVFHLSTTGPRFDTFPVATRFFTKVRCYQ